MFFSFVFFGILLCATQALAGAWVLPDGTWYVDQKLTTYRSTAYWDVDGNQHRQPPYHKMGAQTYVEYGVTPTLTVGGQLEADLLWQADTASGDEPRNSTITDPSLFARYLLYDEDAMVISVQPLLKLPTRASRPAPAPQSGTSHTESELAVLAGHSFSWLGQYHYIDSRAAYRRRQYAGASDLLNADITLGLRPYDHWLVTATLSTISSLKTPAINTSQYNAYSQDYRLLKSEMMLHYEWDNWRVYGGIFMHMAGQNTGAGLGIMTGAAYRIASW